MQDGAGSASAQPAPALRRDLDIDGEVVILRAGAKPIEDDLRARICLQRGGEGGHEEKRALESHAGSGSKRRARFRTTR
jgi:hypothetical protein